VNARQRLAVLVAVLWVLGLLGAYKLGPRAYNRYRLSQLQGRHIYDERLDTEAAFQRGLARANSQGKHLLVMLGGNWCQWCLALDDLMHSDDALRTYLADHFVVLKLDSQAAHVLDQAWGRPTRQGVPVLIFVDRNGQPKHVQETGSLELWHGRLLRHDARRVLELLQRFS
jgi:thiol:disulfide interchange protein